MTILLANQISSASPTWPRGSLAISPISHPPPTHLPSPPEEWAAAYQRLAAEVDLDPDLTIGHQTAARFLDPVLSGEVSDHSRWDTVRSQWREDEENLDQTNFQLDEEAFAQFSAMRDTPRPPSERLRKLLHTKPPWE